MSSILITGANGQLGNELRQLAPARPGHTFCFTDVAELDICDREAVCDRVAEGGFDWIVNCAAYTAVDRAEEEPEAALRINRDAVENLGVAAARNGCRVIHVSTDYVYGGTGHRPCRETDPVAPRSVYGKTKLAGEEALREVCPQSVVLRTAWLYSVYGGNFVKTMIRLGREREMLAVVYDQIGTPTYAADLAGAVLQIVDSGRFVPGIYNCAGEGACSWYDFARTVHRMAGITGCRVVPVESDEYPAKAERPFYSVLNKRKIKDTFAVALPWWEESLQRCIDRLKQEETA